MPGEVGHRAGVTALALATVMTLACSASEAPTRAPGAAPGAPTSGDAANVESAPQAQPERKLTYSADVDLRARDPWGIAEQARRIPADLGGDLLTMVQSGEGDSRSARLTMRVPAAKFEDAIARLRKLDAEFVGSTIDTKDVTEQFVDLKARLASKQREETQYQTLLSQARTVEDTLKVTQALARARTEIEQLQGQLNSLTGRIDYSRISVDITNVADITTASSWQPARTVMEALVALVSLLKFLGDAVIWAVLVGWLPALLIFLFVRARAMYRRRFSRSAPPPAPPASGPALPGAGA